MSLKQLLPGFVADRLFGNVEAIERRLNRLEASSRCLEMALDAILVSPKYSPADEVGFNGQVCRKRLFVEIMTVSPVDAIVETGTCLGDTTGYMAQTTKLPVHTCELTPRFHTLAQRRLAEFDLIHFNLSDSRNFLRQNAVGSLRYKNVFFYLDAHWYDDLPLVEELDIVASAWKEFIVMIDDFQVPYDDEYRYDNYGDGKTFNLDLLRPVMEQHQLALFFPAIPAAVESGARRGCAVLTRKGVQADRLASVPSLRKWESSAGRPVNPRAGAGKGGQRLWAPIPDLGKQFAEIEK